MRKKIMIGVFVFVGLITLSLFALTYMQTFGVFGNYECTLYTEQTSGEPVNMLRNYEYYRIDLNINRTFTITSLITDSETETIATGTFTREKDKVTLTYSEGQNPVEALIFPQEVFTYQNGTLSRNQTGSYLDTQFTTTIVQVFQKRD